MNPAVQSAPAGQPAAAAPKAPRQFVNFCFFKLDPAWRRLPEAERAAGKKEFLDAVDAFQGQGKTILLTYSFFGYRPEVDFMFWRISYNLEDFEMMSSALHKTKLGSYLSTPYSYLSQSKRSTYVDKINPEHENVRSKIVPGKHKYLFIYPFLKTREWYLLPLADRQKYMDDHIRVGNKFPSVKLNTTYSFGIDDQDFVVAFETDDASDFVDLVQSLRETEASKFTFRDTPQFIATNRPLKDVLDIVA